MPYHGNSALSTTWDKTYSLSAFYTHLYAFEIKSTHTKKLQNTGDQSIDSTEQISYYKIEAFLIFFKKALTLYYEKDLSVNQTIAIIAKEC